MKTMGKRMISWMLVLTLVLGLSAGVYAADPPTGITVTQEGKAAASITLTFESGKAAPTVTLSAAVSPDGADGGVTWTVSDAAVLELTGSATQASPVFRAKSAGTATVRAASTSSATVFGECKVTVKDPPVRHEFDRSSYDLSIGETVNTSLITTLASGKTVRTTDFTVDNASIVQVDANRGQLKALANGATTLRAKYDGAVVASISVKVQSAQTVSLSPNAVSLEVGKSQKLTATVSPGSLKDYSYTLTSSNPAIISVDTSSLLITGLAAGSATVTLTVDGKASASTQVTVTQPSNDVSASASAGTNLSFSEVYRSLYNRAVSVFGSGDAGRAMITLNSLGSESYGTLYKTEALYRAAAPGSRVESGYSGSLSTVGDMYFVPGAAGNYNISYSMSKYDGSGAIAGTISVRVTTKSRNVRISIEESSEYIFSQPSRSGSSGAQILTDTIGGFAAITFGNVESGSNVGTLYTTSAPSYDTLVKNGTRVTGDALGALYFIPNRAGTYEIKYTANSTATGDGVVASGVLSIVVGGESAEAVIYLDDLSSYRFGSRSARSSDTGEDVLRRAVNSAVGSGKWSYIRFSEVTAANAEIGKLYVSSSASEPINSNTYVAAGDIESLYFVPARIGSFEIGYSVYSSNSSDSLLTTGTLRISISSVPHGEVDIAYSTTVNGTVSLSEDDFIRYFQNQRNTSYKLSYVVFNSYSNDYGTFSCNGSSFVPYNSADFYTEAYTGSTFGTARYLKDVTFTAPATAGYQAIRFTCYGGTEKNAANIQVSGVLCLFVTAAAVPAVTYTVTGNSEVSFTETEFSEVYRAAMNVSAAPVFYIRLLGVPELGSLNYTYANSSRSSTRITNNNRGSYDFYVGSSNSDHDSVKRLRYIPFGNSSETDTVRYVAFSTGGIELYAGTISFRQKTASAETVDSGGVSFSASDFASGSADDPVVSVILRQPDTGKLYLNYANGKGTVLQDNTRLSTSAGSDSVNSVAALTYVPRAGATGSVTLNYTACTRSGASYADSILLTLRSKNASDTFTDVTSGDVGSWAANAIDYASKWGLVNGVSSAPPYRFAPRDTMRRCDLVLILYRIAGSPQITGSSPYVDVPADAYYFASVLWASRQGILNGLPLSGMYAPNTMVTREEFAAMLYNFALSLGESTATNGSLNNYTDVKQVSSYAYGAMQWAVSRGYITSTSTSALVLSPTATATRAEIATLLHRYLTY